MRKTAITFFISIFSVAMSVNAEAGSLKNAMMISAHGLKAQSQRMEIVAENIANSETTGISPNDEPYRRKVVYFENVKDFDSGYNKVQVERVGFDYSDFQLVYRPDHPAANEEGYVKLPNVNRSLENIDMQQAQRSYEANISVMETTKKMVDRTLDLMR